MFVYSCMCISLHVCPSTFSQYIENMGTISGPLSTTPFEIAL